MPPKEEKKEKKIVPPPPVEPPDENSKDYYVSLINDEVAKIERYEALCADLESKNKELRKQLDQLTNDKKDIVDFIQKKLDEKTDEINNLQEQLTGLQQAKEAEKEAFEQQLKQLRAEYHETRDQLTSENQMLSNKLASLEDFIAHREELIGKMKALENALQEQDKEHKQDIYLMERKQVIDRDRLKKNMITRVNQVAAEFRKQSSRQMAETTKRTIRENISINSQLTKMSDATEEMLKDNSALKKKEQEQRREIENLEEMERQLSRKNANNLKIIRALTAKCDEQNKLLEEVSAHDRELFDLETQYRVVQNELTEAQDEMAAMALENEKLESEQDSIKGEYDKRIELRRRLEQTLIKCANTIKTIISAIPGDNCLPDTDDPRPTRESLLHNLLTILNSAYLSEKIPEERDTSAKSQKGARSFEGHYRLGDGGLIPRPSMHISTNLEKTTHAEAMKRSSRKVPAGSQTPSNAKTMYFADELVCKYSANKDVPNGLPPLVPPPSKFKSAC